MKKPKLWIIIYLVFVLGILGIAAGLVIHVDPFFHYHAPETDTYYYQMDNERSQNDGIARHFFYDALITGTSTTENFLTSEVDRVFGVTAVKVPFAGATFHEIHDILETATRTHPEIRMVFWGLDMVKFFDRSDQIRDDLGNPPEYLYDDNLFNDVYYVLNRDVLFSRVLAMLEERRQLDFQPGITSFDEYMNWMSGADFGWKAVYAETESQQAEADGQTQADPGEIPLTEEEKEQILENVRDNITSLVKACPDTEFYCFLAPYSAAWWENIRNQGKLSRQIAAEELIIEELLTCENLKLFSFNNRSDITGNLNHYKDSIHYGSWINSLILKWMQEGYGLLTKENYRSYRNEERELYLAFPYESLKTQEDYEDDLYAAALVNEALTGAQPLAFDQTILAEGELQNAVFLDPAEGAGFLCTGTLNREPGSSVSVENYLYNNEYQGWKITLDSTGNYRYLVFTGQKLSNHGQPRVYVYDGEGNRVAAFVRSYTKIDEEPHRYTMELPNVEGPVTILFQGGYIDSTGSKASSYLFRDICLY